MQAVLCTTASLALCAGARAADTQGFPARPVRIVAPFAAGGGGDLNARRLADRLSRAWGEPVVVQNVTGAAGNAGAATVAAATPDGYTLLYASHPILAANPWLYDKLPFDAERDFAPVVFVAEMPHILLINLALPVLKLPQLVAYAKTQPGGLNFGSGGPGTSTHLAAELLKSLTGMPLTHVPYKGAAPAVTALIGGEIQMLFDASTTALNHIRGGRVRGLAVASLKRLAVLPELPTLAESGVPRFEAGVSHGLLAPAKTPTAVIARLNRDVNTVLREPEFARQMAEQGVSPVGGAPEALRAYLAAERAKWGEIIRRQGIKAN